MTRATPLIPLRLHKYKVYMPMVGTPTSSALRDSYQPYAYQHLSVRRPETCRLRACHSRHRAQSTASPHEIVSTLVAATEYPDDSPLSHFSWAALLLLLLRAGNVSLLVLNNDEGNHNWLLVAISPARKIRKLDHRRVHMREGERVLDFFALHGVIRLSASSQFRFCNECLF